MRELRTEGRSEDVAKFDTVDTGLWGSQQWEEMGDGQWIFSRRKENLLTSSLLHSSVTVWNNMCKEHLNNHRSFKKLQPVRSSIPHLFEVFNSCIISFTFAISKFYYNRFRLVSWPVQLVNIQLQWARMSLPKTKHFKTRQVHGSLSPRFSSHHSSQLFQLTENQAIIFQTTNILHLIQSEIRDMFPFDSLGNRWGKL